MKRLFFIISIACVCIATSAQSKKIETFDKNTWHWTEGSDKYQNVMIEDGVLVIQNLQKNKKATPYEQIAKSYAKLPLRPQESFKLTIKYFVADYNLTWYWILFNTDKKCLDEDADPNLVESYLFNQISSYWVLGLGDGQQHKGKIPGKVKQKGEFPMEFVLEKKSRLVTIELNGVQLYEGELQLTNPCIGFQVPLFNKKNSYIKIDEVIVEQADPDDE